MKKLAFLSATAVVLTAGSAALAAPENKATNAAYPNKGTLCIVRGTELEDWVVDPDCTYHVLRKYDKDGNLIMYKYQDKGNLQEGQTVPDTAWSYTVSDDNCISTERATHSGQYQSSYSCTF